MKEIKLVAVDNGVIYTAVDPEAGNGGSCTRLVFQIEPILERQASEQLENMFQNIKDDLGFGQIAAAPFDSQSAPH